MLLHLQPVCDTSLFSGFAKYLTNFNRPNSIDYSFRALDVTSKERAFFWKSENFTRLLPGSSVEPGVDLIIMHEYMKLNYANPKEYQNIVQPQIMEEWKYTSREFKRANQRHGRIKNAYLVDTFENKKGVETNLFSVSMELDSDSFWCSENFSKIGKLTLNFDAETKVIL